MTASEDNPEPGSLDPVVGRRFHHAADRRRITTVIDATDGYVRTQDNDGTRYVWTAEGLRRNWIELDEPPND